MKSLGITYFVFLLSSVLFAQGFDCTLCPNGEDPVPGSSVVDVDFDLGILERAGIDLDITCEEAVEFADQIANTPLPGFFAPVLRASCNALQSVVGVGRCGCSRGTTSQSDEDGNDEGENENPRCTLCFNGAAPNNPDGSITVAGVEVTCRFASFMVGALDETQCTIVRGVATVSCGCPVPIPGVPTCSLCGDGSSLPNPNLAIAEESCGILQNEAGGFFSDCKAWQSTAGVYCGCYGKSGEGLPSELEESTCRICTDSLLPNPSRIPEGFDDSKSCGRIEIDENIARRSDCESIQETYSEECCKPEPSLGFFSSSGFFPRPSRKSVILIMLMGIMSASFGFL